MPVQQLKKYLDEQEVRYVTVRHSPAFTAQEVAASAHISGYEMAKTVMIKVNGKMTMAVLPAPLHVDLRHLKELTGADKVELAGESEFKAMFPDCELGAMPPFGRVSGRDPHLWRTMHRLGELGKDTRVDCSPIIRALPCEPRA